MQIYESAVTSPDILIAEDDAPVREGLRLVLQQEGYTCAVTGDGLEAVELAWHDPPSCVLLDLGLPGLDGFAVARRLRSDPRTRGAAIHCLTGRTDPDAREEARRAGCDLFLAKPVDVAAVVAAVRRQVAGAGGWVSGLTEAEAEELLDWLEAHGSPGALALGEDGFAVRCPGFRAHRGADGGVVLSRHR